MFVDYEDSETVGIYFINPCVYLNNIWFQQLNLAIDYSLVSYWEYVREAL